MSLLFLILFFLGPYWVGTPNGVVHSEPPTSKSKNREFPLSMIVRNSPFHSSCYKSSPIEELTDLSRRSVKKELEADPSCYHMEHPTLETQEQITKRLNNETDVFNSDLLDDLIHQKLNFRKRRIAITFRRCGFAALLKQAKTQEEYENLKCQKSPWKDLNFSQRAQKILEFSAPHAERYHVDPETMLCISARETTTLEPLKVDNIFWRRRNKDPSIRPPYRGLGQITKDMFDAALQRPLLIKTNGRRVESRFISSISPFNLTPYTTDEGQDLLFDVLAVSPNLQLELMAYTLSHTAYTRKNAYVDWKHRPSGSRSKQHKNTLYAAIRDYNGHDKYKHIYAETVLQCRSCLLKKKRNNTTNNGNYPYSESMVDCLNSVMPEKGRREKKRKTAQEQFDFYKQKCDNKELRRNLNSIFKDTANQYKRYNL